MATKNEERIAELDRKLAEIQTELTERTIRFKETNDLFRISQQEAEKRLRDLETELASLKQKTSELDKRADRSWSLTQALVVVTITALVSALTQLAIKR